MAGGISIIGDMSGEDLELNQREFDAGAANAPRPSISIIGDQSGQFQPPPPTPATPEQVAAPPLEATPAAPPMSPPVGAMDGGGGPRGQNEALVEEPVLDAPEQGLLDQITKYVTKTGGDAVDLMPAMTYRLLSVLPGQQAQLAHMTSGLLADPDGSGVDAFTRGAVDGGTIGLADKLAQGAVQWAALESGKTVEQAVTAGKEAYDKVNANLDEVKAESPWWTMGGTAAGSMASGSPFAAGANLLFGAGRVGTSVMLASASQEFLYTLNSDGSLAEATKNAGTAALVGGIATKAFQAFGAGYSAIMGRSVKDINKQVGTQIYNTVRAKIMFETGKDASVADVVKIIEGMPEGQVLSDLYPELAPRLKELATSNDPASQARVLKLIQLRNQSEFDYKDSVLKVVKTPDVRTFEEFDTMTKKLHKSLVPKYDKLYSKMDAAKWSKPLKTVKKSFDLMIDKELTTAGEDRALINGVVADVVKRMKTASLPTRGGKPNTVSNTQMTFRQVAAAKKDLQDLISARIAANNSGTGGVKKPIKNLQAAKDYLNTILSQTDEYRVLNEAHGSAANALKGYKFGQSLITKKALIGDDVEDFMQADKSAATLAAMAEGAKFALFTNAKGAANPASAFKSGAMDDLAAIIGKDNADAMAQAAAALANKQRTLNAAMQGSAAASREGATAPAIQGGLDAIAAWKGLLGRSTGVAPLFAAQRFSQRVRGADVTPTSGELSAMRDAASTTLLESGAKASGPLKAAIPSAAPTKAQVAGMGAAAAGLNGPMEPQTQKIPDYLLQAVAPMQEPMMKFLGLTK